MDRSRHVYLDIALTQHELDYLLNVLRYSGTAIGPTIAMAIDAKLSECNPDFMAEVSYHSKAVIETRDLCLNCGKRPATQDSAECEVCENRELIWNEITQRYELEEIND